MAKKKSPAWQRRAGKNPSGGLNAKGRRSYKKQTGGTLKAPVSRKKAKASPKAAARRKSFCARMKGMKMNSRHKEYIRTGHPAFHVLLVIADVQ